MNTRMTIWFIWFLTGMGTDLRPTYAVEHDPKVLQAIRMKESSGGVNLYGDWNGSRYLAVGPLQIQEIMVDEVNRISKGKRFTLQDRMNEAKSAEMFWIYADHYRSKTAEQIARRWNGGPSGDKRKSTRIYWNEVRIILSRLTGQ